MKKTIVTSFVGIGLVFGSLAKSNAQNVDFGVKVGGNYSFSQEKITILKETQKDNNSGLGFYAGVTLQFSGKNADSKLKGQAEVLFDYNSFKYEEDYSLRFSAIRIPLMAKYYFTPKFNVSLGPTFGFNIGTKIYDLDSKKSEKAENVNTVQIGALLGLSYGITNNISIDLRYNQYFSNLVDDSDAFGEYSFKYNTLQLGLSYKF